MKIKERMIKLLEILILIIASPFCVIYCILKYAKGEIE